MTSKLAGVAILAAGLLSACTYYQAPPPAYVYRPVPCPPGMGPSVPPSGAPSGAPSRAPPAAAPAPSNAPAPTQAPDASGITWDTPRSDSAPPSGTISPSPAANSVTPSTTTSPAQTVYATPNGCFAAVPVMPAAPYPYPYGYAYRAYPAYPYYYAPPVYGSVFIRGRWR